MAIGGGKKNVDAASKAANEASEAARVLQSRRNAAAAGEDVAAPRASVEPRPDAEIASAIEKAKANNPNKLAREDIRRRREEQAVAPKEEPKVEVEEPKAETPKEEVKVEPTVETVAAEPKAEPVAEAPKVKVKIDGVESEVTQAEVDEYGGVKAYQIAKANENRLKATNEALAESRRMQAAMVQMFQAQAPKVPQVSDEEFIASKMDVVRFGTPQESAAAMREILSRTNPRQDQNAIVLQTTTSLKRDLALEQFQKEFQDITANPLLNTLVSNLEQKRLAQFVNNGMVNWGGLASQDWGNFYRGIGNEVRSAIGRQHQPATSAVSQVTEGTTSPASEKEARKASIVTLPTASARAELPKEPKPETREESLNRMRKSRGQPIL